jgi:RNA polymerase sigma-70 factor (ECF subfamily)
MAPIIDPDINLVKRIQESGDKDAFNTLYDRYINKVYNFCLAFTGDDDDAKDCTQEVFIRVYRSIGKFRSDAKFNTWLYRIINNTCKDMVKKVSYRKRMVSSDSEGWDTQGGSLDDPASNYPDPYVELTRKEMREQFLSALKKLKPAFRRILILRDIEGRSYEEISEITGRNPGTVRSSLARGRHRIATYLKAYRNEL